MTNQDSQTKPAFDNSREVRTTFESKFVWWLTRIIAVVAIAFGLLMTEFYDWTGADQSRPAPVVGWIGLGILIADAIMLLWLAWLHFTRAPSSQTKPTSIISDSGSVGTESRQARFSILQLLLATTVVAVFIMLVRLTSLQIASLVVEATVAGAGIWVAVQYPWTRPWIAWIAIIQFTPFMWVFRKASISNAGPELLGILGGLPSLVPVAFVMPLNRESLPWVSTLFTSGVFAICIWLSYLGSKRALAGGIVVATLALFSSFVFHALLRM